jgi:cytochrome c oxidase subunit 2
MMQIHQKMHLSRSLSAIWRHRRRVIVSFALLAMLALFAFGCDVDTPQNTFDTKGEVASKQKDVFLAAMWPALIIMIGVLAATVIILIRFRRRSEDYIPKQTHGNTRLELAWTIAPAIILLALGIPMVATLWDISRDPSDDAFVVNVEGQRFLWRFEYPELVDENGNAAQTFREVTVPAGREVALHLTSIDVIHSFWVPKLAGKLDAVPGRTNTMWLKADEPGSFSGQCAEFCGLEHANMSLIMHALGEDDFEAWADEITSGDSGE